MFGSVVASTHDATAAYWNTASLTQLKCAIINIGYARQLVWWHCQLRLFYHCQKIDKDQSSLRSHCFIRMGVDNIPNTLNIVNPDGSIDFDKVTEFSAADYAFLLSYARTMGADRKFAIGGNLKVIRRVIGTFGGAWGFGADMFMHYKAGEHLQIGGTIRDITTTFNTWSLT